MADPGFRFTQETPQAEWCRCIPIGLHGDEGRGKAKQPVMVISLQTILPVNKGKSNMTGPLRSLLDIFFIGYCPVHSRKKYMIVVI